MLEHYVFRNSLEIQSIPEVQTLLSILNDTTEQLKDAENGNVPIYCPECASCGTEGCCSPDACVAVRCLYPESNQKSYNDAQKECSIYSNLIDSLKTISEHTTYIDTTLIKELISKTEQNISEIWNANNTPTNDSTKI